MMLAIYITFYAGVGLFLIAAAVAAAYLRRPEDVLLGVSERIAVAGALLLLATLVLRAIAWDRLPLTNFADALNLFVLLTTLVVILVSHEQRMRPLLSFYLPPIAIIAVINGAAGFRYLDEPPLELRGVLLTIHVGLAFLAYALFLVGSITSIGYIFQAQRLKRHRTTGLFQRLPSLERLDKVLFRLIGAGYPLFGATVVLGFFWAYLDRELLGAQWWLAPKVLMALVMALFYSLAFHSRRLGWLRGPKLAYFVFFGFTLLLAITITLGLTQLNNYNFWDTRA